jgi:hypothetical protein
VGGEINDRTDAVKISQQHYGYATGSGVNSPSDEIQPIDKVLQTSLAMTNHFKFVRDRDQPVPHAQLQGHDIRNTKLIVDLGSEMQTDCQTSDNDILRDLVSISRLELRS